MVPTFKPWEELTISDNYMFQLVMREPKLCKHLLERILKIKIKDIQFPEYEKTILSSLEQKSIRLDVYVKDDSGRVYDIEMQCVNQGKRNLAKRSLLYQSMIATEQLDKGADYETLNPLYVIFLCNFDLFGFGMPVYEFNSYCKQNRDILLLDDACRIFVNSKAADKAEDPDLADFLRYMEGKAATERFTQEIDQVIRRIKAQSGKRRDYMLLSQEIEWEKRRAIKAAVEKAVKETVQEQTTKTILRLLSKGHSPENIAEDLDLPLQDVLKLANK